MKLHELQPAPGSTRSPKRIGRGQGSTRGGTSTRGHNGAQSRAGYSRKFGFEGGQQPLQRRVPKFGFKNPNRVSYITLNLGRLSELTERANTTTFTLEDFVTQGVLSKNKRLKILAEGNLTCAVDIQAHAISKAAQESITQAGGTIRLLDK